MREGERLGEGGGGGEVRALFIFKTPHKCQIKAKYFYSLHIFANELFLFFYSLFMAQHIYFVYGTAYILGLWYNIYTLFMAQHIYFVYGTAYILCLWHSIYTLFMVQHIGKF